MNEVVHAIDVEQCHERQEEQAGSVQIRSEQNH